MTDFAALRQRMVDNQIRPSAVTDHAVIRAFLAVPREEFVARSEQPFAYADRELRMDEFASPRKLMPPVQLARLVQALPRGEEVSAMVVGCGTGYSAAVMAKLCKRVIAVEEDESLAQQARTRLAALAIANVAMVTGPLSAGWPAEAPYEGILVDGAVDLLPDAMIQQLNLGGLLAAVERDDRLSHAMLYERTEGGAAKWPLFEAWAPLLPGFERPREFVF